MDSLKFDSPSWHTAYLNLRVAIFYNLEKVLINIYCLIQCCRNVLIFAVGSVFLDQITPPLCIHIYKDVYKHICANCAIEVQNRRLRNIHVMPAAVIYITLHHTAVRTINFNFENLLPQWLCMSIGYAGG